MEKYIFISQIMQQINSMWTADLRVKDKTTKLSEDNIFQICEWTNTSSIAEYYELDSTLRICVYPKEKNKWMKWQSIDWRHSLNVSSKGTLSRICTSHTEICVKKVGERQMGKNHSTELEKMYKWLLNTWQETSKSTKMAKVKMKKIRSGDKNAEQRKSLTTVPGSINWTILSLRKTSGRSY